jgi:ElaA protein
VVPAPGSEPERAVQLSIITATFADLDARTLYRILRLRNLIFVVEQRCAYLDLDGRDLEPETRHCWIPREGEVAAYLRVVTDEGRLSRIGRVVTAPEARGQGLAARLVHHALTFADRPVVLDAQSHLVAWYEALGFVADGPGFVEDGIPHTPMRRS